jgi:hypothetical protein
MKQIILIISLIIILTGESCSQVFYEFLGKTEKQVTSIWGEPIVNNVEGFKMLSYVTNNEGTMTSSRLGKPKP